MSEAPSRRGKCVVIVGGGIGGVVAAYRLRRRLPRQHRVVLVNRDALFSFAASYLWVMTGQRTEGQVTRPLRRLERRGIDLGHRRGRTHRPGQSSGHRVRAHDLRGLPGGDPRRRPDTAHHPGSDRDWRQHRHCGGGADQLRTRIDTIDTGRVLVLTAAPIYRCPAAPYEAAFLIDANLRGRGVRDRVHVGVRSAEPMPMGVVGTNVADAVIQLLDERGIDYHPASQVTAVEPGLAIFEGADNEAFDLLAYMPPIAPPAVLTGSPLAGSTGWIDADRHTLATNHENVYAVGDNAQVPLSIGKPLPRAGVFAHGQDRVVADRIAASILGKPATALFDGHGGCFIEIGGGRAGYGSGHFFAEPSLAVRLRAPARYLHWGKVAFEQDALRRRL